MSGLKSLWAETPTVAGPLANNTGEVVHAVAAWANDMHRSVGTDSSLYLTSFLSGVGMTRVRAACTPSQR